MPGVNDRTVFDERLRSVPADRAAYRAFVEATERELDEARQRGGATAALLRRAGYGHLVLRQLDAAKTLLTEAASRAGTPRARLAALINLGDAYRYGEEYAEAEPCYRRALRIAHEDCPEMLDFPLQHLAKHHMDLGDPDTAEKLLMEALQLRQARGDAELIAATERVLARCAELHDGTD